MPHAVLWDHGQIIAVGTLPNGNVSFAIGIDVNGQIPGTAPLDGRKEGS
ncbi:MAG: hypothetical protein ABI877_15770 [Gemmatimonadaceae bacterium]